MSNVMLTNEWKDWLQTEEGKDTCFTCIYSWINLQPNVLDWILREEANTEGLSFVIRETIPTQFREEAEEILPDAVEIIRQGIKQEHQDMVKEISSWDDPSCPKCGGMITPNWDKKMCLLCFICSACGVNYDRVFQEEEQQCECGQCTFAKPIWYEEEQPDA